MWENFLTVNKKSKVKLHTKISSQKKKIYLYFSCLTSSTKGSPEILYCLLNNTFKLENLIPFHR